MIFGSFSVVKQMVKCSSSHQKVKEMHSFALTSAVKERKKDVEFSRLRSLSVFSLRVSGVLKQLSC